MPNNEKPPDVRADRILASQGDEEAQKRNRERASHGGQTTARNNRLRKEIDELYTKVREMEFFMEDQKANITISTEGDILPIDDPLNAEQLADLKRQIQELEHEMTLIQGEIKTRSN